MRVKDVAQALNLSTDAVRYYTRIGLLNPSRSLNGYKHYRPEDVARIRFIISARNLGFSVNDVKEILKTSEQTNSPCPTVRRLIEQRLKETEERFNDMRNLRERMRAAIRDWSSKPDQPHDAETICHLIESFTDS
tara:strand:+ start:144 stop:548 length:405 start_codon:yes stop_codon:yes gene_type:complete